MPDSSPDMFRPPVNRAMRTLDRAFFRRRYPISAARVADLKSISRVSKALLQSKDAIIMRMVHPVRTDPVDTTAKCVLLRSEIRPDEPATWSECVGNLVKDGSIRVVPYELELDYDHWTAHDILSAILPDDILDDIPSGFNPVGHIAHYNLRPRYLPHKHLIGQVAIDKNSAIRTVINKTENLGEENEFRVLDYELIAGDDDMRVELKESNCLFRFDFSKVFWNSRLGTEHQRLVDKFMPGEAVCDVMAGVGPFAVPAAKKGLFVWANDLNPECHAALEDCISLNKVTGFAHAFREDGHTFIPRSAAALLHTRYTASIQRKLTRTEITENKLKPADYTTHIAQPRTFAHYVMNLPSTAIDFLPDYIGLYAGHEALFVPNTSVRLPMIHCYCFGPKYDEGDDDGVKARQAVCEEVSRRIGSQITLETTDTEIWDVRDVAPNKRQFCASFRLPPDVAFRKK